MNNSRYQNEKMKRRYFEYCRGALGWSEKTIKVKEGALWKYDEYTAYQDYKKFNLNTVKGFKKWLETNKGVHLTGPIDKTTQYHVLRALKAFFTWLSTQNGYRSKIHLDDVGYLRLSNADTRIATSSKMPRYPSLDYIKKLCDFSVENEVDQRDKAVIAFCALSAMRVLAISSLPFGCFDANSLVVTQYPSEGVKTKFSKSIVTTLFRFDERLLSYVLEWHKYLKKERFFDNKAPFFPATNMELESEIQHTFIACGVSNKYWSDAGPIRRIFKMRASQMGIEYYSPHKFRHFAIRQASNHAIGPEQMKAISQNVGHERVATTFMGYGAIDQDRVSTLITGMDFTED